MNPNEIPQGGPAPLIAAASVVLLRDKPGGIEVLMLRRNRALKSFGGAWVFPGGRVDPNDALGAPELDRAKAAAIREAQEETGLTLSADALIPLSLWIPPIEEKRRFSTWFFIAKAPNEAVEIDHGEIHEFAWMCPCDLVNTTPNPQRVLFPPTYITLHRLMGAQSVEMACQDISGAKNEFFETRFEKSATAVTTLWHGDCAYEGGDLNAEGPRRRLVMNATQWEYVTSG